MQTGRHQWTDKQTDKQAGIETGSNEERQMDTDRTMDKQRARKAGSHILRQKNRPLLTDRLTDRHRRTNRERGRQTDGGSRCCIVPGCHGSERPSAVATTSAARCQDTRQSVSRTRARLSVRMCACVYVPHCLASHGPGDPAKLMSQLEGRCTTFPCLDAKKEPTQHTL